MRATTLFDFVVCQHTNNCVLTIVFSNKFFSLTKKKTREAHRLKEARRENRFYFTNAFHRQKKDNPTMLRDIVGRNRGKAERMVNISLFLAGKVARNERLKERFLAPR